MPTTHACALSAHWLRPSLRLCPRARLPARPPLHNSCADVSNDVRRAAVLNLGFVLAASPEQCPKIVSLLAESYNPHVR